MRVCVHARACTHVLARMCVEQHKIRTEKHSDTCQHNIKFVLIFNDLISVKIYAISLNLSLDNVRSKYELYRSAPKVFGKYVRCPNVLSSHVCVCECDFIPILLVYLQGFHFHPHYEMVFTCVHWLTNALRVRN